MPTYNTYTFLCERCKKSFEVVLTVAARAAATVACPTCGGGAVTPQMAIFTAKTSRKS
jgi:putative FmdB family regulatory protein